MWIVTIIEMTLLLSVFSLNFEGVATDGETKAAITRPADMPCKAAVSLLMKRQLAGIASCSKTMKFKNGKDKAAKMSCILKCVMIDVGILTSGGEVDNQTQEEFALRNIPQNLWDKAMPLIKTCMSLGADGKVDPKEEFCKSYAPMIKCILEALPKFCQE